jgi:glycosyltransferase involved in cell wall biosynthesis
MMPKVSIILPTFNRIDTIMRAIKSAQRQSLQDWELIVIDDGSTDNTAALIEGSDPRLELVRQENRGFTEARNAGIRAAKGEYLAFLDSDDEFLPHHLELCVAFLDEFKCEAIVSTELLEDFGHDRVVNHYRVEVGEWYPEKAAIVGSRRFDLPPGETDDYLRVYESREPIGGWGRAIIERIRPEREAFLYRGRIFDHLRFDFLITITATVFRTSAVAASGLPEPRWRTGSDFHFMATLCKVHRANYLSIPTIIKHEYADTGDLPASGHIVSGRSALSFAADWQVAWDDLFWNGLLQDTEVRGLRSLRQLWMGEVALRFGQRKLALEHFAQARKGLPQYWKAKGLYWLVRCTPHATWAQALYSIGGKFMRVPGKLRGIFASADRLSAGEGEVS